MTTIAYKNGLLAADSRMSRSGFAGNIPESKIKVCPPDKVWKIGEDKVIAFGVAGDISGILLLQKALEEGIPDSGRINVDVVGESTFNYILIGEDPTKVWDCCYNHNKQKNINNIWAVRVSAIDPRSIGSGKPYALGAMSVGKTAVGAVKVAISLDPHSGGKIDSFTHPSKLKVKKPKEAA